jgi:hypothetical protein
VACLVTRFVTKSFALPTKWSHQPSTNSADAAASLAHHFHKHTIPISTPPAKNYRRECRGPLVCVNQQGRNSVKRPYGRALGVPGQFFFMDWPQFKQLFPRFVDTVFMETTTTQSTQPPLYTTDSGKSHLQPRERLLRDGARALSDEELLAVLLGTGTTGVPVKALAARVLPVLEGCVDAVQVDTLQQLAAQRPASWRLPWSSHAVGFDRRERGFGARATSYRCSTTCSTVSRSRWSPSPSAERTR